MPRDQMTFEDALKIRARVAVPEHGYPSCESLYADTMDWEKAHHDSWSRWFNAMQESFCNGEDIW